MVLPGRPFGVNAPPPRRITPQFPFIAESDLPYIFPNIGAFANTNLGFMG